MFGWILNLVGPFESGICVARRPTREDCLQEFSLFVRGELIAKREGSGWIGGDESSGCSPQNGSASFAFGQFIGPKHGKVWIVGEFNTETGFDSVCADVIGAVPGWTEVALCPLRYQGEQGCFAFCFVCEVFGGAQCISPISCR